MNSSCKMLDLFIFENMKQILLVSFCLLVGFTTFGQRYGIKTGLNVPQPFTQIDESGSIDFYTYHLGWQGNFEFGFSGAFRPAVQFVAYVGNGGASPLETIAKSVDIPLIFSRKFTDSPLFLGVGFTTQARIGEAIGIGSVMEIDDSFENEYYIDLGPTLQFGGQLPNGFMFTLDYTFEVFGSQSLSFTDPITDESTSISETFNPEGQTFRLSVGYMFDRY